MPAILVEASECEEDPALIVARKLEERGAAGLGGKAQDLLRDGRLEALVDALVGAAAPLLLPSAEESEARGCFTCVPPRPPPAPPPPAPPAPPCPAARPPPAGGVAA